MRDWGVGIADVEQARTPLFTTGSEERSGMGFTIMESFMDSLRVRSAPGKGTTVTMRRQIARRRGGMNADARRTGAAGGRPERGQPGL